MRNIYEVIRRPLVTEKATALKEGQGVRVANVHGKVKRQGRYAGKRPDWKKAFVVLKKGEKMIEFFEQA